MLKIIRLHARPKYNKNEWMQDLLEYELDLNSQNDPYSEKSLTSLQLIKDIGMDSRLCSKVRKRALGILWEHAFSQATTARKICQSLRSRVNCLSPLPTFHHVFIAFML